MSPLDISPQELETIAEMSNAGKSVQAMKHARESMGVDISSAKAIVHHLAAYKRQCHRCKSRLRGELVTTCVKCRATNYDRFGATAQLSSWSGARVALKERDDPAVGMDPRVYRDLTEFACVRYALRDWESVPVGSRGVGFWTVEREGLRVDRDESDTPVVSAWFVRNGVVERRDPGSFARFVMVHGVRPWCSRVIPEPGGVFDKVHEIGIVEFARYLGTEDLFLSFQWGGTHGRAYRAVTTEEGLLQIRKMIWIS